MELITIYNTYRDTNKQFMAWLEQQVDRDFQGDEVVVGQYLRDMKQTCEELLQQTEIIQVEEAYEKDLKDLQYLVADTMILTADLITYYHYKEIGRLKMRAINYVNKRRRSELFGQ